MQDTRSLLIKTATDFPPIQRDRLKTLQVNLGYKCNMSCVHCHVNAGPTRTEMMDQRTINQILGVLQKRDIETLDLTGGAPELHPQFRELVIAARQLGVKVIDRCNLTVLFEPEQENLAPFLAEQEVEIVASLPCYLEDNVDKQRGKGTYEKSMEALQLLNGLGYGAEETELVLNLVYNPVGPHLPPGQESLEADYKRELKERFGIQFNHLLTITNMPISRFGAVLLAKGEFDQYMTLLRENYSAANLANVMCKTLVSIDYQGNLYDCDFNQMLDLPLTQPRKRQLTVADLLNDDLYQNRIAVRDHCFGCTAGQGSSCSGALG